MLMGRPGKSSGLVIEGQGRPCGLMRVHSLCVVALMCAGLASWSCGENPSSPTASQSQTDELVGHLFGCTGEAYLRFVADEGPITLTLVETTRLVIGDQPSNPPTSLQAYLCSITRPFEVPQVADCAFLNTQIAVGQTLTAQRKGGAERELFFWPLACGVGPPSLGRFGLRARVIYRKIP